MEDISIWIAIMAGFLSFFSPCILPLIPAYITYITGTYVEEELNDKKLFALTRTLGFVVGFSIIFMIMGVSASFIGKLFIKYKYVFSKISGVLIILFGLNMIGFLNINILNKEIKILKAPKKISNWFSSIIMGMAFAAGWTPCFGAVLGSILIYASSTTTVSKGFYLLLAYSIGMGVPFIITSLIISRFGKFLNKYEKVIPYISKFSSIIIIGFGILVFLNKMSIIANMFI
ncbi:cytochrome c biogenesis CcdA family protein [Tepidibacter formicigenes]|jgi:cytochrome c-type biogenesis protein|uniref:Cytochrome c-type biogenesis protein n=1 Tax=Tepidibacter formicigenes DSM 15518 TaxID=1123349 RepID=A0A1M6MHX3_9FIRM|nr:cytochrome c biogenesis protein CcdA [Tepidibacter formicigenes]SHJ83034.1 cytochrome c-type biogenesis protein [Tepidibacter formicigenes DSM 15518]